jgi:hypothetical protein
VTFICYLTNLPDQIRHVVGVKVFLASSERGSSNLHDNRFAHSPLITPARTGTKSACRDWLMEIVEQRMEAAQKQLSFRQFIFSLRQPIGEAEGSLFGF